MGKCNIRVNLSIHELNGSECKRLDVLEFITPDEAVEILTLKYCNGKKKKVLISMR